MELEALEAILMDDLQPYSGMLPDGWATVGQTYKVVIDPTEEGEVRQHSSQPVWHVGSPCASHHSLAIRIRRASECIAAMDGCFYAATVLSSTVPVGNNTRMVWCWVVAVE